MHIFYYLELNATVRAAFTTKQNMQLTLNKG